MLLHGNDELRKYVVEKLKTGWSPKTIAGRMQEQQLPFYASDKAIYEYLYSPYGQQYCKYLRSRRYAKRKKKGKKQKRTLIPNKTSIHKRPKRITNKREYGHYEGDTIVSGKSTGSTTAVVTIYERKAMYIDAKKITSLSPTDYNPVVKKLFGKLNKSQSWTLDNGIENVQYEELEKTLGIKSYFCDAYSSWQKPGVENANKLIRRFIPKGADISLYSDAFIRKEIQKLNDTPRKALGWKTPNEVMVKQKLLKKKPKQKSP
jgi:transposase, IS30 family